MACQLDSAGLSRLYPLGTLWRVNGNFVDLWNFQRSAKLTIG